VEVNFTFEGTRRQVHLAVLSYIEPQVDALVNGESCHQTMLMVYVCTQRTHTIRGIDMI
jgi:hypothetical protein